MTIKKFISERFEKGKDVFHAFISLCQPDIPLLLLPYNKVLMNFYHSNGPLRDCYEITYPF